MRKLMLDVDGLRVERFATTYEPQLRGIVEANGDTENRTCPPTCHTCPCSGVDCP